jgi:thiol-disulfide isomerase/thioredoxin
MRAVERQARRLGAGVLLLVGLATAAAADPPGLPSAGQVGFTEFEMAEPHRAFAIAPGGGWAWRSGLASANEAEQAALRACAEQTEQSCVAYAVDDAVVFDRALWPTLWRPYAVAAQAARADTGTARGQRFPDLAFHDPDGRPMSLSGLRGKVVVVHFWGSWCIPCLTELPELAKLAEAIAAEPAVASEVALVLLQGREPVATARRLLSRKGYRLSQYDSGVAGQSSMHFTLADGAPLEDRLVAPLFPTTYVLDRHGLVLFAVRGLASGWVDYLPFLKDALAGSR